MYSFFPHIGDFKPNHSLFRCFLQDKNARFFPVVDPPFASIKKAELLWRLLRWSLFLLSSRSLFSYYYADDFPSLKEFEASPFSSLETLRVFPPHIIEASYPTKRVPPPPPLAE